MRLLWTALGRVARVRKGLLPVFLIWFSTFAAVGGEVAWAMRPFVGSVSPDYPVVFLRKDALDGNVYEFIVTDILPHLVRALGD
jgi:K+ transporter